MKTGITKRFCDECGNPDGGHYGWCGAGQFEDGEDFTVLRILDYCGGDCQSFDCPFLLGLTAGGEYRCWIEEEKI